MSPRFLILVLRNVKTKLLGFGMESSVFPQTQAHWSCNEQSCGCRTLHGMAHKTIPCYLCFVTDTHSSHKDDVEDGTEWGTSLSMSSTAVLTTNDYIFMYLCKELFFLVNNVKKQTLRNNCFPFPLMAVPSHRACSVIFIIQCKSSEEQDPDLPAVCQHVSAAAALDWN